MPDAATAFAPGSIGNVGPGLDILGLAFSGRGDSVTLTVGGSAEFAITDAGHRDLPADPERHTAAIAARAVFSVCGFSTGVTMQVTKGLPLSGGQGGSAASAIAGAVAANHLCQGRLDATALLDAALLAESTVSGRHADNLAPALLGGLVLIRSVDPIEFVQLPVPAALWLAIVHPEQRLDTREAREVLPTMVPRPLAISQAAALAMMVAGACRGDVEQFGHAIDDRIAEPARAPLLPGFIEAKRAALAAGALGCSISGAGPTSFAVTGSESTAQQIAAAMVAAYATMQIAASALVTTPDFAGARIVA